MDNARDLTTLLFRPDDKVGYRIEAEIVVDLTRKVVFEFFADAMELGRITPPWVNFSVQTPQPIEMRQGLLLDYRIKLHQIPIRWQTEICVWEPPFRFVDQQLRGPYKRWYHEHTFEELDGGRTLVRDEVHYIPRGGSLIHRLMVRPDLEKIFQFRQDTLKEIFAEKIAQRQASFNSSLLPLDLPTAIQTEPAREFNS